MDKFLKNINHEEILSLKELVSAGEGQVVSRTLAQNEHISITLFAFAEGEEISTHESDGDALVTVLEGRGKYTVDGREYILNTGESLVMPARKPHSVLAAEKLKMQLTVVFPETGKEK